MKKMSAKAFIQFSKDGCIFSKKESPKDTRKAGGGGGGGGGGTSTLKTLKKCSLMLASVCSVFF